MPCMSGMLRSSTIRSTGSIASRSMASSPLPAWEDLIRRSEPNEVITMRLIVGESSTTKILFILRSSDIARAHYTVQILPGSRGCEGKSGERYQGTAIVRESTEFSQKCESHKRRGIYQRHRPRNYQRHRPGMYQRHRRGI